jgi:uncharacterized protein (DUF433 family)
MATKAKYQHLEKRPDKRSQELFVRGTGIRASTIWHDRYISRHSPDQIAKDRDLSTQAVSEALAYCQEHWEIVCQEAVTQIEQSGLPLVNTFHNLNFWRRRSD